jgi:predicted nucleic acid-binding protein
MSERALNPTDRAEAAARWLLSLSPEDSSAVVERLSRETLEEIRVALRRLGEPEPAREVPAFEPDRLDDEPPLLLAALVAATPAAGRDALRAAIAARRGPEVLAAIDAEGVVTPVPAAGEALRAAWGGRP